MIDVYKRQVLRSGYPQYWKYRYRRSRQQKDVELSSPIHPNVCTLGLSLIHILEYDSIEGLENIDKVVDVDQSPLGRTPRSNPATYTGVFSDIRNLFVGLPEAKIRGYKPGRFSFNVAGGRCEARCV